MSQGRRIVLTKIAFIAYYFSEQYGVGASRSRYLAEELEKRENQIHYYTKETFGDRASDSKLLWMLVLFIHLMFKNYDRLYVSCGPFWHLRIVLLVCVLRRKKLIVDFRDPWSINLKTGFGNSKPKASLKIVEKAERMEKWIYKYCKYFWVCTPGMKNAYSQLFGNDHKIRVVLNGHGLTREQMELKNGHLYPDFLSFVCLGKFVEYGQKKAEQALSSIRRICLENHIDYNICFVGSNPERINVVARKVGVQNHVKVIGKVQYEKAVEIAADKDIGICIVRDEEIEFGTKIFDYIGLGLPVFDCFEPDSNFREFFSPFLTQGPGKVISFNERERFKRSNMFKPYLSDIDRG